MNRFVLAVCLTAVSAVGHAAAVTYKIDPSHTYPSFEADHMGVSLWRGKFNTTSGSVTLDTAAGKGSVDIVVDLASVDFGHDKMNEHARGPDLFNVSKFPTATYKGKLAGFSNGVPTRADGELTLNGKTQPLVLKINSLKCKEHPMLKRPFCGADAIASFKRDAFGLDYGSAWGFNMDVTLRIQVEAVKE